MNSKYSKLQWFILFAFGFINFLCSTCLSSLAPFYPMVAESKEATPSQYAIVIAMFSLAVLIFTPVAGIFINKYGAVKMSLVGLSIVGISSIMLAFVDRINEKIKFISTSAIARTFEGLGYAMVRNSGLAIVTCEFSENVEMAFSFVQSCSSAGALVGPIVGGALFELGGFTLPFASIGALLMLSALCLFSLPNNNLKQESKFSKQILKMLRVPAIIMGSLIAFGAYFSLGFIFTVLEPHLQRLDLSPFQVGSIFLVHTLSSSCSTFLWSKLCEKVESYEYISVIPSLIIIIGLMLLGPAPYLPIEYSLQTCVAGLLIYGIGHGGMQVFGFSFMNKGGRSANFSQDIQTHGFISTIYTTFLALGFFLGPLVGGVLYDLFGFSWGSHLLIMYQLLICIGAIISCYLHTDQINTKLSESIQSVGIAYNSTD